jgi:hypothetical protein
MPDEFSNLSLEEDLDEVSGLPEAASWDLSKPTPLEILATFRPATTPGEQFRARLLWERYPDEPPSLKFLDPATGRLDLPSAWPLVRGFRPQSVDACVTYSKEGFVLHPEWRNDPRYRWKSDGNPLLKVLRIIQAELDETFQGRFKA